MFDNIIMLTDSYKTCHYKQYPPKTETVYSYFESRGGKFKNTLFFGLQYLLKQYFQGQVVTNDKIDYAEGRINLHMGPDTFNREGWRYIVKNYDGRLPVIIKAVPEGTLVPTGNVLMTIENTDPNCYWLTNYLETLLVQTWYPTTVATQSYYMKQILLKYLEETGSPDLVDFKLHDFGFRGSTSVESAAIGGAAHLVNFNGTDTLAGIEFHHKYYNNEMAGFSIPASEHSTITAWGKDREVDAFENMLDQYPDGLIACVSDSFNIYKACGDLWGKQLKEKVLARDGCLVVRPDSGNPPDVVCKVLTLLGNAFGFTINNKGYKILNPAVRVIQGDGIDINMLETILEAIKNNKWSADNIAFGSGGGLLQKLNRDTCEFAFKCSSVTVDGQERDVWKTPITDSGKDSKRGRLKLINVMDKFHTVPDTTNNTYSNELVTVFRNGGLFNECNLEDVRNRTNGTKNIL